MAGIRDEVALQYYRLDRVHTGAIGVAEGELQYVKPPTETGTRKAQDDQAPLSEIIETLNERFGTQFTEEDRLFFDQIKERACNSDAVVRTALANTLDRINSTGPMGKLPLLLSYIKSFPSDMQQSVPRSNLLAAVTEGISETPVVALLGARQVGKTTLAGQVIGMAWAVHGLRPGAGHHPGGALRDPREAAPPERGPDGHRRGAADAGAVRGAAPDL